jgi:phosphatidylserine/phosphatidylglycerophosphate/cardiolipin synthase-like enzyme
VRYRIRAVGRQQPGLEPVVVVPESHHERNTGMEVTHTYTGTPIPLAYLTPPAFTNAIEVTSNRPPFRSTFTNGILSTQFLLRVLTEDSVIEEHELESHLKTPNDWMRAYLAGDVLPIVHDFFNQPGGRFHAALYELEDQELVDLLKANAPRIDLILSDAGSGTDDDAEPDDDGKKPTIYDTRNSPARSALRALADAPGSTFRMQDRMFNGSGHIGHNKFVVRVDATGKARSVLTGSTNWTWSGVSAQSNNCIRIDDDDLAAAYLAYWQRLHDDALPLPVPLNVRASGVHQGDKLRGDDRTPLQKTLPTGVSLEAWFSPNIPGKSQPPSKSAPPASPPPDMDRLFSLMRKAQRAIFFLVFLPSRGGINSIVSEAVTLGQKDTTLNVIGAISDTQAMWGYVAAKKAPSGEKIPASSPHIFQSGGVSVIRATALTDKEIHRELGDFRIDEKLTAPGGKAIIHDKILVIDPLDPENCVVAFGSHNFGYKASYSNDENLVIVRGHQALAEAYAAHVLDVYDHYRFRAVEAELSARKNSSSVAGTAADPRWDGFLDTTDRWQLKSSRRLSDYFTG